ncbi:MAG: phosphoribosylanthranilate isomerase [Bacteroidaceae bacterium]|nr:phosphoribosylanthranilate isomerase [Bacteroidaceae bacterium]
MIVKVCGMRNAENIRLLDEAHIADWMGFIFYPQSPRYVAERPTYLPRYSQRVGVFVNENTEGILAYCQDYHLDLVQLHGNESPSFCQTLRVQLPQDVKLIKALPVSSATALCAADTYSDCIDYLLFETPTTGYGGSGKQFDWNLLHKYHGSVPFLLTGGIGPGDVAQIRAFRHPRFIGIDLNSRFETAPALKDIQSIKTFKQQLTL